MAQIKVSSAKLTEEATHIERLIREMETEIGTLTRYASSFLNSWEGDAKQAFVSSVQKNATLLKNFTNNAKQFSNVLKTGAQDYETGENRAKQIASTKR